MDKGLDFTLNIILTFDNLRNFVILVKISCILKENGHAVAECFKEMFVFGVFSSSNTADKRLVR